MKSLPQNNDKYQVYFFTCPIYKPFNIAVHPWVVTVKNGTTTRWEVIYKKYKNRERFGYVYKNFYSDPTKGVRKHPLSNKYWNSSLLGLISGDEKSLAKQMFNFIEEVTPFYSHQENYKFLPGPNSNTYIAWILRKFPESKINLPWNAFGKNYK